MKNKSKSIENGKIGENIATRFLMKHGFKIVERNYLKKCGEIDIIAIKEEIIRFIEVKCVSCENNKYDVSHETDKIPEENVTREKIKKLSKTIQVYLKERKISHETLFQIDVVGVRLDLKNKIGFVNFIENVF